MIRSAATSRSRIRNSSPARLRTTAGCMPRRSPACSSISAPVSRSNSTGLSGTNPRCRLASVGLGHTCTPSIVALPSSGRSSPMSIRIVVVLPAPFGPAIP